MWAAMTWDGEGARAWSVMGRLRDRQDLARNHALQARRRLAEPETKGELHLSNAAGAEQDSIRAEWQGSPTLIALVFAPPDSAAMRALDARVDLLDQRTGDTWDLFFPGYYKIPPEISSYGDRPLMHPGASGWHFNGLGFEMIRRFIEEHSDGRWTYSGETDLVLIGGWMPEEGEITIDWASILTGQLTDQEAGITTLTLGEVVERITRDLEGRLEDSAYGAGTVVDPSGTEQHTTMHDFMVSALASLAAAFVGKATGI
jgi:hypothetical protein